MMLGLARLPASTASLLLTLEGAALIALFVFREHIGWRNGAGFALITLGGASPA
jgi:drug/metabolite transporter (DMT)-like permease